jgi:hypothetical protein
MTETVRCSDGSGSITAKMFETAMTSDDHIANTHLLLSDRSFVLQLSI